jgi:outer membrane protein
MRLIPAFNAPMLKASRIALCALALAAGARAHAADLLDVFRQAKVADPTYAAARAAWAATQERIPQARARLLPFASLTASAQYSDRATRFRDSTVPRSDADFVSNTATLTVTQPIYRKDTAIEYAQAFTQVEQADAQLALAGQDLILRVADAYFAVLLAQDNVALAEAQLTAIGQQLEQAKRNFEVGTATITDTHEAQARFDLTSAQLIVARNDLELRRRALEQIIARSAPPLAPLGPRLPLRPPQPAAMDAWVQLAQSGNLQVRVAQSNLTFSAQEIDRHRAAHAPTLDAFVTLSASGSGAGTTGSSGTDTRSTAAGVQLSVPLYQGGAINSRVREAIANQGRARDDLERFRRDAEFSARQSFLGITSGIAQVQALEAALVSTESQLASTRLGQEVGVRTQVDVLNAQQLLFSARRDLAGSKYDYVRSLLRLEAAIGELTEDDLAAVNQWLDAAAAGFERQGAKPSLPPVGLATPTPVPPRATPKAQPLDAKEAADPTVGAKTDTAAVLRTLEGWAQAWSSNDVRAYLAYYSPDFELPRGVSRSQWEAERTARIQKPRQIAVTVSSPVVRFEQNDRAVVRFRQQYRSGPLNVSSEKTLVLVRSGERWLIEQERIQGETQQEPGRD